MDTTQTPTETSEQTIELKPNEKDINRARIEAMVTPEQVLSDTVARKRRKFTKKRGSSLTRREPTPIRTLDDKTTTSDEETPEARPKMPERRRQKRNQSMGSYNISETESDQGNVSITNGSRQNSFKNNEPNEERKKSLTDMAQEEVLLFFNKTKKSISTAAQRGRDRFRKTEDEIIKRSQSAPHNFLEGGIGTDTPEEESLSFLDKTKKSITSAAVKGRERFRKTDKELTNRSRSAPRDLAAEDSIQEDFMSFINKTKKTITTAAIKGRDKFRKTEKELVKRSQSAPNHFTEEELIESFKKAQPLGVDNARPRKYSDTSISSLTLETPVVPKPFRPEVQTFVRKRKKERQYSKRVVEIIDKSTILNTIPPKTYDFKLINIYYLFRMYSIFEMRKLYIDYKLLKKDECNRIRLLWNKCMLELFLIMMFCGMGGIIFKFTEGSFENFYKCGVKRVKRDFIDLLWVKSHNLREDDWKSLARNRLRIFEEELHAAHEAGMTSYSGQRSWSFLNGVVYAITVVTTIGYGHLYPTTTTGRALTIVYSIIGIPLFLIALTDFGKLFTRGIKFLWSFVRRVYYTGSCRSVRKTAHVEEIFKGAQMMYDIATFRRPSQNPDAEDPEDPQHSQNMIPDRPPYTGNTLNVLPGEDTPTTPAISNYEIDDEFNLPISVALFILISYIFVGALGYSAVEKWDFFASFYFVFISMSTIGFGDYVPKQPLWMILSIVYLVFGLALMSMCINVVQEKLSETFKQASSKLGATIGFEMDENGSVITADQIEMPGVHAPKTP